MVITAFSDMVFYFLFFSFVGWAWDTLVHLLRYRKLANTGFLYGPYKPMYGIAGVLLILLKSGISIPLPVFLIIAIAFFIIYDYAGNLLLEKITNFQWWDYRDRKLQIRGRVYLPKVFFYAVIFTLFVYYGGDWIHLLLGDVPHAISRLIASGIIILMAVDQYYSIQLLSDFQIRYEQWEKIYPRLTEEEKAILQNAIESRTKNKPPEIPRELLDKMGITAKFEHSGYRLLKSFPTLRRADTKKDASVLRDLVSLDRQHPGSRRWAQAVAAFRGFFKSEKKETPAITVKLNFYKIFWIFLFSGVIGYVLETIFALVTRGVLESRQGVIYGPFNQVYGFGAVLMVLTLLPLANKRDSVIFLGSAIVGGAFEWFCSFIQEKVFKTVSWQYDEQNFSIGPQGRTSLMFMLFWGILGVLLIKFILPRIISFIDRMLKKQGVFLTWVFFALIIFDMGISGAAVYRWSERLMNIPPKNKVEIFLDEHYPDNFMEEVYPSMRLPEMNG